VRGRLIVLGLDDQRRHADSREVTAVHICAEDGRVEVVPLGRYGEQTVDDLGQSRRSGQCRGGLSTRMQSARVD